MCDFSPLAGEFQMTRSERESKRERERAREARLISKFRVLKTATKKKTKIFRLRRRRWRPFFTISSIEKRKKEKTLSFFPLRFLSLLFSFLPVYCSARRQRAAARSHAREREQMKSTQAEKVGRFLPSLCCCCANRLFPHRSHPLFPLPFGVPYPPPIPPNG